eukprot:211072_1
MGVNSSTSSDKLVVRDHTFDYDLSGIQYLKAHEIPQLFEDITARLLAERPLDSLLFIHDILIHKMIDNQYQKHSITYSASISPNKQSAPQRRVSYPDSQEHIVQIGCGVVGGAYARAFDEYGFDVSCIDVAPNIIDGLTKDGTERGDEPLETPWNGEFFETDVVEMSEHMQ